MDDRQTVVQVIQQFYGYLEECLTSVVCVVLLLISCDYCCAARFVSRASICDVYCDPKYNAPDVWHNAASVQNVILKL